MNLKRVLSLLAMLGFTQSVWALPVNDGLVMNLNADSINTSSLGVNGEVSVWPDSSGMGNSATQSSSVNQPVLIADNDEFKGHATVMFDGQNDWMQLNSSMITVGNFTMFAVGRYHNTATEQYFVSGQTPGQDDRARICMDNSATFLLRAGNSALTAVTSPADTDLHVFALTSEVKGYRDSEFMGESANTADVNPGSFGLGSYSRGTKNFLTGDIAAVIVYNRVLTEQEILDMSSYLYAKYGISVSNPAPEDGAVGVGTPEEDVMVTLEWDAAPDPEDLTSVDPDVAKHYIYITDGTDDPNLYLAGEIVVSDPSQLTYSYGPLALDYDGSYTWMIEEALYDGVGGVLPAGDPNNYKGEKWSFDTVMSVPDITLQPASNKFELGTSIALDVEYYSLNPASVTWYKDDETLVEGEKYTITSDQDSSMIEILDLSAADEGSYYCIVTSEGGSTESEAAMLVSKKLLASYDFEENLEDGVADNDGTAYENLTYTEGIVGSFAAESSDGTGYALLTNEAYPKAGFGNGLEEFTYSFWVKPSPVLSGEGRLFGCFNDGGSTGMQVGVSAGGALRFYLRQEGGSWAGCDSADIVMDDQWSFVTYTYNGSEIVFYLNGSMVRSQGAAKLTNFASWQYPMAVLAKNSRGSIVERYAGQLDDLKIYNYSMNELEVASVYNSVTGEPVCIESMRPSAIYDLNGDCSVDINDMAMFAQQWLNCGMYPTCVQ